jgi:hypothetical protein
MQGERPVPSELSRRRLAVRRHGLGMRLRHDGRRMTVAAWSAAVGIDPRLILRRLKAGWPVSRVLTEAPGERAGRPARPYEAPPDDGPIDMAEFRRSLAEVLAAWDSRPGGRPT